MNLLLCGLPGSGNHLIMTHARRCGQEARLDHAWERSHPCNWDKNVEWADVLIYPLRLNEEQRQASAIRRGGSFSVSFEHQLLMRDLIYATHSKPIHTIIFEEIVRTQGRAINQLFAMIGIEPHPFPTHVDAMHIQGGRILTQQERDTLRNP